jgi:uncharacterized membrane protein YraQ (UPF0718 family)
MIVGIMLLLGLFQSYVSQEHLAALFSGNPFTDTLTASLIGSISGGQVINSYIIGGELLDKGISLFAVTAFLLSWVTVGIIQLPLEISMLGKGFAIFRNLSGIILAAFMSLIVVYTLQVIA